MNTMCHSKLLFGVLATWLGIAIGASDVVADNDIDFQRHVRPILTTCFACHGPDEEHREADLRFDTRVGATADLGGHAAIVPGEPDRSVLLERVASDDPDVRMPPPEAGDPLTAEQIAILRTWIADGAKWSEHWAFVSPPKPEFPTQHDSADTSEWIQNPIDAFILERLATGTALT